MENLDIKSESRIFLTDYASYNDGSQFEFGHWVELDQFDDADELYNYISEHFKKADFKSPLFSPREEMMITDFEGFPKEFYSECMNFNNLFEFFEMAENCDYDIEIIEAFSNLGFADISDTEKFFEELENRFIGEYENDEEFAEEMIGEEQIDKIPSFISIDWERTAEGYMQDYTSDSGYYFSNC
ncbi:MAG: antirestriction protein ArdA [Flavobacteriaceae bacterium]|nr:antirestriction protein ArdA [Flavobacteriaceae bacterium]